MKNFDEYFLLTIGQKDKDSKNTPILLSPEQLLADYSAWKKEENKKICGAKQEQKIERGSFKREEVKEERQHAPPSDQRDKALVAYMRLVVAKENNGDAKQQANKLLTLFDNSEAAMQYLADYIRKHPQACSPIHDACNFGLPAADTSTWTPHIWKRLLTKNNYSTELVDLLPLAADIEKAAGDLLEKLTKGEILFIATTLTYGELADRNPEAASLFKKYNLPKEKFEQYLKLEPKDDDKQIPTVDITHEEENATYRLKKLKANNPVAAVLGELVGCCQSLGKMGEPCVIHGITAPDSGFYVIEKSKKIVAQTWAWRVEGTLVFDSIEYNEAVFKGKIPLLCRLFRTLADKIVQHEAANIQQVLVGTGGRTPPAFGASIEESEDKPLLPNRYSDLYTDSYQVRRVTFDSQEVCKFLNLPENTPQQTLSASYEAIKSTEQFRLFCYYFSIDNAQHPQWQDLLGVIPNLIAEMENFREVVRFLHPTQIKELADHLGVKWLKLVGSVEAFHYRVRSLGSEQRQAIGETIEERLPEWIGEDVDKFSLAARHLAPAQISALIGRLGEKLSTVVKSINDFPRALARLDLRQSQVVLEAVKERLSKWIENGKDFSHVLSHLYLRQRQAIFEAVKERLPEWIENAEDFSRVLNNLDLMQRQVIFEAVKERLPALIKTVNDFYHVFRRLEPTQIKELAGFLGARLPTLIKYAGDFSHTSWGLNQNQQQAIIEAAGAYEAQKPEDKNSTATALQRYGFIPAPASNDSLSSSNQSISQNQQQATIEAAGAYEAQKPEDKNSTAAALQRYGFISAPASNDSPSSSNQSIANDSSIERVPSPR